MENVLRKIKKLIPKKVFTLGQPIYHYLLTISGAIIYGFPANKIKVIGVTGTKGKSTTTEIINSIFETAGYKALAFSALAPYSLTMALSKFSNVGLRNLNNAKEGTSFAFQPIKRGTFACLPLAKLKAGSSLKK